MATGLILAVLLGGCTVGPDFNRPAAPDATSYTPDPLPGQTVSAPVPFGRSQRLVQDVRVNPQWWRELGSPRLNALIDEALQASPTLAASRATLRRARETYAAQSGSTLYPRVDANINGRRQRFSPSTSGQEGDASEFSLYNADVGVRYNLDLAGGNRSVLEALAANIDYQRYQQEGARLTLTANIVTTAITRASLAARIEDTEAILHSPGRSARADQGTGPSRPGHT